MELFQNMIANSLYGEPFPFRPSPLPFPSQHKMFQRLVLAVSVKCCAFSESVRIWNFAHHICGWRTDYINSEDDQNARLHKWWRSPCTFRKADGCAFWLSEQEDSVYFFETLQPRQHVKNKSRKKCRSHKVGIGFQNMGTGLWFIEILEISAVHFMSHIWKKKRNKNNKDPQLMAKRNICCFSLFYSLPRLLIS